MARLFVAVWPPAEVLDHLECLPRPEQPGVRWTSRGQWHITLRFLGDVDPAVAADALDRVAFSPSRGVLGPAIELLGSSVAVVPVSGIDEVAASVRSATTGIGQPQRHPFAGHLTIARLRRDAVCPLIGRQVDGLSFRVDEVALVESDLDAAGARYTTLRRVSAT